MAFSSKLLLSLLGAPGVHVFILRFYLEPTVFTTFLNSSIVRSTAKTGRTKTFYAREAILKHLDDMEDNYLAIDRLENSGKR